MNKRQTKVVKNICADEQSAESLTEAIVDCAVMKLPRLCPSLLWPIVWDDIIDIKENHPNIILSSQEIVLLNVECEVVSALVVSLRLPIGRLEGRWPKAWFLYRVVGGLIKIKVYQDRVTLLLSMTHPGYSTEPDLARSIQVIEHKT